jgi:KaiC/GvpD/RAD55 family RecA-like ATPase
MNNFRGAQSSLSIFERGFKNLIFNCEFPPSEIKSGYRLLIKGFPGTGKTTLGLHLLNSFLLNDENSQGLILYYQENPKEYNTIKDNFGLNFYSNDPEAFSLSKSEFKNGYPFLNKWIDAKKKTGFQNLCVLVDGLSILKSFEPLDIYKYLNELMTKVHQANLLLIIIAEENIIGNGNFFEYIADGVIRLSVEQQRQRHRYIEITKMRYLEYSRGKHGFELTKLPWNKNSILRIYPKPSTHLINTRQLLATNNDLHLSSGIQELDHILGGTQESGALQPGDTFVIICEPGTRKLDWGLSFLQAEISNNMRVAEPGHLNPVLWASFGPSQLFSALMKNPYKTNFFYFLKNYKCFDPYRDKLVRKGYYSAKENVISKLRKENPISNIDELLAQVDLYSSIALTDLEKPSRSMHPDRVIDCIMRTTNYHENKKTPLRIVVDDFNNIGRDFAEYKQTSEYIISLARILKQCNAISLIFVDLLFTFQPAGEIEMPWINEVDFVGHLRWFDINNEINMAFSLIKSRYDNFNSKPFHIISKINHDFLNSVALKDQGWSMVSMLSGRTETIHEAKVFFKFFDQSYTNRIIHEPLLENYGRRYSGDQKFAYVNKRVPNPKHWSFLGYAGAGHSNTKVVCLTQTIMNVLENDDVLLQFPEIEWEKYKLRVCESYPSKEQRKSKSYSLWNLLKRTEKKHLEYDAKRETTKPGNSLPVFADIGVLCCQIDHKNLVDNAVQFRKTNKNKNVDKQDIYSELEKKILNAIPDSIPMSWDSLFDLNKSFQECSDHPPWIKHLFALPSLTLDTSCFFSFFLELLFSFSGLNQQDLSNISKPKGLNTIIEGQAFVNTIKLLRKFVWSGTSPSPLEKINYHTAYFSRRWFSTIEQYELDDPELVQIAKCVPPEFHLEGLNTNIYLEFNIAPLPSVTNENNNRGISCLEFYSAGIIKGALAPETAFMFISELLAADNASKRFEKRRGLPVLREHWYAIPNDPTRLNDKEVIDAILDADQFFCLSWIPNYWQIESKLGNMFRNIFIGYNRSSADEESFSSSPTIKQLRREFLIALNEAES